MKTAPAPALTAVNLDDRNGDIWQDDLLTVNEAARLQRVPMSRVSAPAGCPIGRRVWVAREARFVWRARSAIAIGVDVVTVAASVVAVSGTQHGAGFQGSTAMLPVTTEQRRKTRPTNQPLTEVETVARLTPNSRHLRTWRTQGRGRAYMRLGRAVRYLAVDIGECLRSSRHRPRPTTAR